MRPPSPHARCPAFAPVFLFGVTDGGEIVLPHRRHIARWTSHAGKTQNDEPTSNFLLVSCFVPRRFRLPPTICGWFACHPTIFTPCLLRSRLVVHGLDCRQWQRRQHHFVRDPVLQSCSATFAGRPRLSEIVYDCTTLRQLSLLYTARNLLSFVEAATTLYRPFLFVQVTRWVTDLP